MCTRFLNSKFPNLGTKLSISEIFLLLTGLLNYNCCSGFFKRWGDGRLNWSTATSYLRKMSSTIQLGIRSCSILCLLKFSSFSCMFENFFLVLCNLTYIVFIILVRRSSHVNFIQLVWITIHLF